jgi:hypothetical protein
MLEEELAEAEKCVVADTRLPASIRKQLDPRARLLKDLRKVIDEERARGFRPIVLMDANEDWSDPKAGKSLRKFMTDLKLKDPLYDRFNGKGLVESTYSRGRRRIDFMLFDEALVHAIKRIGTLGLHHAIVSDHVMVYADIDESLLFQGLINRPVRVPTREFVLAQADKCELFVKGFKEIAVQRKFQSRAARLYAEFERGGATDSLVREYNILDNEIQEHLLEVASARVKRKYGYNRSPDLGKAGMKLNFWKAILSSKQLQRQPSKAALAMAEKLGIEIEDTTPMSRSDARKAVRSARDELREVQYSASEHRQKWLEKMQRMWHEQQENPTGKSIWSECSEMRKLER